MIERVVKKIREADLILVGLGEELDTLSRVRQDQRYQDIAEKIENPWILPFIEKVKIEEISKEKTEFYRLLADCLAGRNYFVVSVCLDGVIRETELDGSRTVEPCGGYGKMQCSEKCSAQLYDIPEELLRQVRTLLNGEGMERDLREPCCPHCGSPLAFNNVNTPNYLEEGYLEQWAVYKKWLQGTVNRNVCILELGVGMKYPTVIRWPFEKITFFNQKAELFRVHSRLYQIAEEISRRGHGICAGPEDFFRELSNAFWCDKLK